MPTTTCRWFRQCVWITNINHFCWIFFVYCRASMWKSPCRSECIKSPRQEDQPSCADQLVGAAGRVSWYDRPVRDRPPGQLDLPSVYSLSLHPHWLESHSSERDLSQLWRHLRPCVLRILGRVLERVWK